VDGRKKLESPANIIGVLYRQEYRGFTGTQALRSRSPLHYPTPDFSKIKPRVNTYNTPISGSGNRKVSSAVACFVVQVEASNPPGIG
jgi:hypothetical protein